MIAVKGMIKILLALSCFVLTTTLFAQRLMDSSGNNANADTLIKKTINGNGVIGTLTPAGLDTSRGSAPQSAGTGKINPEYDAKDFLKDLFKGHHRQVADSLQPAKKLFMTILPAAGYTLQTAFAVTVSGTLAFYLDTAATKRFSEIITSITYTQYNQFLFPLYANIWTKQNNYNFIVDYRFLKYPSTTYGLGARTLETDAYSLNFNYVKLHQTLLKKIYRELYGGIGFYYDYFWNVTEVDPPAGTKTSFQKYGGTPTMKAAGMAFKILYDSRQNQINPNQGFYANFIYRPNYTFLGSDNNWQSMLVEFRKYFRLNEHTNNVLALWSYNWFTMGSGKPPYLLLPSTGWDDLYNLGRGYIQSRYRAKNMVYAEAEYRFGISSNGFIGGVVFANAQSFSKNLATQLNVIAPAVGTGIRIKFNKYSKTNLCIDYGFGINGSRGLFLNLGEVF